MLGFGNAIGSRHIVCIAATALLLPLCGCPTAAPVGSVVMEAMAEGRLPGVACGWKTEDASATYAFGVADTLTQRPIEVGTPFMLASISKTFVAVAAMQVVESGVVGLDDDVNAYLPFEITNPRLDPADTGAAPITLRGLLTHTASIRDNFGVLDSLYVDNMDSPIPLGSFLEAYFVADGEFFDAERNFFAEAPGSDYAYSNVGIALAALVLESALGMDFAAYCEVAIFAPLGMDSAGWFLADFDPAMLAVPHRTYGLFDVPREHYGYPDYPDGQLRMSMPDLLTFLDALRADALGTEAPRLLDAASVAEMWTVQYPELNDGQGLVWYSVKRGDTCWWSHSGGDRGVSTDAIVSPLEQVAVVVLANGDPLGGAIGALQTIEERLIREALPFGPERRIIGSCSRWIDSAPQAFFSKVRLDAPF